MKMERRKFRIGELAKKLNVERFVIRFWEKEFKVQTTRSSGGQRFYSEEDYQTFKYIKELLHKQGFTIAGARKQLSQKPIKKNLLGSHKTTMDDGEALEVKKITKQIVQLQKKLVKLRDLL